MADSLLWLSDSADRSLRGIVVLWSMGKHVFLFVLDAATVAVEVSASLGTRADKYAD